MSLFFNLKLLLPVLLLCHASSAEEKTKIDIRPPGSEGQRQGLYWFGPRLGKRSVDDRKQTLLNLFEAADTLKYYYDQLPSYETPDEQENKGWKIFFTPKLGRSLNNVYQDEKRFENVEFTPRLGRRLPEDYRVTQPDQEVYKPDPDQIDRRAKFFSPRLGRSGSVNFSPRLGRNIAYGITTLIIKWTNSYVLLAANLEDFKKVAKKFVPEKLALQIANIATASPMNRDYYDVPEADVARVQEYVPVQETAVEEKETVQESEANQEEEEVKHENNRPTPYEYEENTDVKQLDFEDLVQQVKERIEQDILKKKQKQSNMNQQAKLYASTEPEDMEKIVERKRPEKYTEQRYREEKRPERKPRKPEHIIYSEEKKYPKINHPQGKRPASVYHKEESYIDQEDDSPRQQTKNKGMQHNRDIKQNKDREKVKLSETPNDEYENPHDGDEIDQSGKVVHNHQQYEEKQRYPKYTPKFKYEEQLQTVSPDTHGKYKENKNLPVEEDDEALLYTKITMTRNDSYEDYVTPKKENNIYASNESLKERAEVTNTAKTKGIIIPLAAKVTNEYEEGEKNDYYNDNPNDLKARTENLDYSYDTNQEMESKSGRDREQTTPMNKVSSSTQKRKDVKKGKATMIPKRDFYKISSPNYYAKIPIVAEKYDFNEPIPEKDREPEDTRSFPMPPSAINGKVIVK